MSYILDALKRADAERERGVVPGLYTRQVTSAQHEAAAPAASRAVWLAATAALALVAMALGLWAWRTASDMPLEQAPEPALVKVTPPAPTTQPLPADVAAAAAQPAPPPVALPVPAPSAPDPAAVAPDLTPAKRSPAVAPRVVPTAPASRTAGAAVPLLAELPEALRRQVPALTITGAIYSDNPAQRLLVVNNQVLNQGSEAAPDVRLDEIGINSSVFSFRGTRFRLAH